MIDELNQALAAYQKKWDELTLGRANAAFFHGLTPTAVAWKTQDLADFDRRFAGLRDQCDQIHLGWMNERWIAVLHLKDAKLGWGIRLIKLMQRRPGSLDATGLDHVDFSSPTVHRADQLLAKAAGLTWTHEENGPCKWVSVWFDGTEAKLRTDTTLDVCIRELQATNRPILPI